jgi:glyoxylase-like metal-dependent hydrolase (beta-lactamase superfamily II)
MAKELATAESVREVAAGVWHWSVHDDRIDFVSSSHAVTTDEGVVLIDPMPLRADALAELGTVSAICLTSGSHQRASWRYRRDHGAPVYAPALAQTLAEEPEERYGDGDRLPGGLLAVFTPGAGTTQHALLLERDGGIAFTSDLFVHSRRGGIRFVPARYMHDPEQAHRSARKLLELSFAVLCMGHGEPVLDDPKGAIEAALERDDASRAE